MSPTAAPEAKPTRRSWLSWLLGTSLGAVALSILYPVFRYVLPPPSAESQTGRILAGRRSELPPSSGKIFRFGARPGIVIATPGGPEVPIDLQSGGTFGMVIFVKPGAVPNAGRALRA